MNRKTDRLNLPYRYRRQVENVFRLITPYAEVWAYGSRLRGTNHHSSDLDVVLRGPELEPIPVNDFQMLRTIFDESNMPLIIDLHDWARIPESFHREIERLYIVLVNPSQEWPGRWEDKICDIRAKLNARSPATLDRFAELVSLRNRLHGCIEVVESSMLSYDPDSARPEAVFNETTIGETIKLLKTLQTSPGD